MGNVAGAVGRCSARCNKWRQIERARPHHWPESANGQVSFAKCDVCQPENSVRIGEWGDTLAKARRAALVQPAVPLDQAIAGVLAMLVAEREDRLKPPQEPRKIEWILDDAGVGVPAIAKLTGKNSAAVRMSIARRKRKPRSKRAKA
jgi:hypothetical protein